MNRRYPLGAELTELMTKAQEEQLHERLAAEFPDVAPDDWKTIAGFTDRFLDEQRRPAQSEGGKRTAAKSKAIVNKRRQIVHYFFSRLPVALRGNPYGKETLRTLQDRVTTCTGAERSLITLKRDLRALGILPDQKGQR